MRKQIIYAFSVGALCVAFRQNIFGQSAAQSFARATEAYTAADYAEAQCWWEEAAVAYERAAAVDSAALSLYSAFKCDWHRGDLGAMEAFAAGKLTPVLGRLDTDLARALDAASAADIAYKQYDILGCERHLQVAYSYFEAAGRTRLAQAIDNRRMLAVIRTALGRDMDSTLAIAQTALDVAERYHASCSETVAYAYLTIGGVQYVVSDMKASLQSHQLAYQILEDILPDGHPQRVATNLYLAELHAEMDHPVQALHYARVSIDRSAVQGRFHRGNAYLRYSNVLSMLELPQQARYWLAKAREVYRDAPTEQLLMETKTLLAVVENHLFLGDARAAAAALDTLRSIDQTAFLAEASSQYQYYRQLGDLHALEGDDAAGLAAYRTSVAMVRQLFDPTAYQYQESYRILGYALLADGQADSARHYYCLAEPYIESEGQEALDWVTHFRLLGVGIATATGDYTTAAAHLETILTEATATSRTDKVQPSLFEVIDAAQKLYEARPGPRTRALFLRSVDLCDRLLGDNYSLLAAERWTSTFLERMRGIYVAAAFAAAENCGGGHPADVKANGVADGTADWCERAVAYADLPRALALRRQSAELRGALAAGVPDSVLERGQSMQRKQAALRHAEMDSTLRASEMAELRIATAAYQNDLRQNYPQYYASVLSPLGLDAAALAARAKATNTRYVSYLVDSTRSAVLICAIDAGGVASVRTITRTEEQLRLLADFKAELADRKSRHLAELAEAIYREYLGPVLPEGTNKENLVIAADGDLAGLPFSALLTTRPNVDAPMGSWPWLGLQTRVSYVDALASTQLPIASPIVVRTDVQLDIACVAPGFDGSAAAPQAIASALGATAAPLTRTPWTLALGERLSKEYGATFLSGDTATERALVRSYATHDILHLGTHAFLDDGDPLRSYFALTPTSAARDDDGRLYAYEIYGLPTQARLAVLPACGSGAGAFQSGEGTLSLATAFRNSGCPTVVQSFWSIDDQQTNVLLEPFYAHLAGGEPVAAALAAAQRDYLAAAPPELQHPYYWAGLAVVGPAVRFGESPQDWPYWLLGGVLLVCITFFVYRSVHLSAAAR